MSDDIDRMLQQSVADMHGSIERKTVLDIVTFICQWAADTNTPSAYMLAQLIENKWQVRR